MSSGVTPFSLKDAPALIERLLPVQKLSAEAYKEQMAGSGKTLTALGSYWKGRKPLILNRACILGCLLPATNDPARDLEVFEQLMAMDDLSFVARQKRRPKPKELLGKLSIACIADYFVASPAGVLPAAAPVDWSNSEYAQVKVAWRSDVCELKRRELELRGLPRLSYRQQVNQSLRAEEAGDLVHAHVWDAVNSHLGTSARSLPALVEQLGVMRYGHRPQVADVFCGSGQIPFEAARLGCDVHASDLNPVACMLTWGALEIVGGPAESRAQLATDQQALVREVSAEIDRLGVETDGSGWNAKVFLYCVEARCPQTGWMVPLLPTRVVSRGYRVIAELVPDHENKRYDIHISTGASSEEMDAAATGTIGREGTYGEGILVHEVAGVQYKTKISTLRGDYQKPDGTIANRLRLWDRREFRPRPDDVLQERLYCVQWMRLKKRSKRVEYQFRSVTDKDLQREQVVQDFIAEHFADWQERGWLPDMRIEVGGPPRYQGLDLIRARGWTHWQHVWNPRQLLSLGLTMKALQKLRSASLTVIVAGILDYSSKLSRWTTSGTRHSKDGSDKQLGGASNSTANVFYNQALNTLYNYGSRSTADLFDVLTKKIKHFPVSGQRQISCANASEVDVAADIFVTDPPYGDAVKYEEILDFFIAWLRKNPPPEFANWIWDSRRALAIKGEDESFRRSMVAAYKRMTERMPTNGIQVIMFTHQSGSIWADMANIVWASGLQVTAAWYVVTETDSPMREGSYVKGTVLLVLRKRQGSQKTTRDDLAWELQEEVEAQVHALAGLNQNAKGLYRDENVFEDADIQMAGYAAALRVLTRYSVIDGRDMAAEAIRPRVRGETTFVDGLIAFAVDTANQCLVPHGLSEAHWDKLSGAERFYLKMLDMETRGAKTLDNYQNFAKAFKVHDFRPLLGNMRANEARLKSAAELGRSEMGEGSELHESVLRAVLYGVMELVKNVDGNDVLAHLTLNIPNYYGDMTQRELAIELSTYLEERLEVRRPEEASAARVLRELMKNQRLG
jgi:putative DNA methylase